MEDWNDLRNQAAIAIIPRAIGDVVNFSKAHEEKLDIPQYSAKLAVEFADALVDELKKHEAQKLETSKSSNDIPSLLDLRLYDSSFSVKTISAIRVMSNKPAKDVTVGDLVKCSKAELLALRNFGKSSLREIEDFLSEYGLKLKGE